MELDFDARDSRVWQDVKTEAGSQYACAFDYAQRPGTSAGTNTIEVWWNGERVGIVDPTTSDWTRAELSVKADLMRTRKVDLYLEDDGQSSHLMAVAKGETVEVAVLENFSGHTLDDMIKDGMLLVRGGCPPAGSPRGLGRET